MKKSIIKKHIILALLAACAPFHSTIASTKHVIHTNQAPAPIGPYSQAIMAHRMLFLSGQIAIDPKTNQKIQGGVQQETDQVMQNIKHVLEAAHMGFQNVVKTTIFVSDLKNYHAVNEIYAHYFKNQPPARSAVQVSRLPLDAQVEIEMIAYR